MHPILLVGAVLAGLPILLHLIMKQEPKKLLFPAIRFLLQKQKTNQRKMRLRHVLLLLLRVLLVALFALTLWQPKLEGSALNLSDDQPVAAVLVIDNSPGMGYAVAGVTRFDDAKRRMAEFLDELPAGSKVAILDANDVFGTWEPTVGDAKRKIDGMKETAGFAQPLTSALPAAYQLFATADEDGTEPENRLPRVLAVFGDRAANSWDANRLDELKKVRDAGTPAPVHLFFDVGAENPVNVAIAAVEMRPQLIPATAEAVLTVTVRADGAAVPEAEVTCQLDDAAKPERKQVALPAGGQQAVTFTFRDLKPGFHSAVIRIRDDNLAADNVRHFTFQVAERRKLLTVADDPESVRFWKLSHNFGKQEFDCTVVATKDVTTFDGYEAVCLISVGDPSALWGRVKAYAEAGGKVFVAPPELLAEKFNKAAYTDAIEVLPAKLTNEHGDWRNETWPGVGRDRTGGVTWKLDDDRDLLHPFLAPFRDWKKRGNVDVLKRPARAWRYWDVEKRPGATVVVSFDDADEPEKRSPALLERSLGKGKVLMLTTRLDDPPEKVLEQWNDYWTFTSTWPTVFPNLIGRYLIGSPDDAVFNFVTGQDVTVPLPKPDGKPRAIALEGPGVIGRDSKPEVGANQAELRVTRPITLTAGTYTVRTEDRKWEQRFSLSVPPEESVLEKAPEEAIAALFGPDSVLPVGKAADLKKLITARTGQPVPLFPWLLILVLILFAAEGLFANRFYKARG